jgi:hypothetical protein
MTMELTLSSEAGKAFVSAYTAEYSVYALGFFIASIFLLGLTIFIYSKNGEYEGDERGVVFSVCGLGLFLSLIFFLGAAHKAARSVNPYDIMLRGGKLELRQDECPDNVAPILPEDDTGVIDDQNNRLLPVPQEKTESQ